MGDISKSIKETNAQSKSNVTVVTKQPQKPNVINKQQKPPCGGNKNILSLKQKQEQQAIIMAMKTSSMSPKATPTATAGRYILYIS